MAEATAESPNTVLPEELMIEILSRVGLNNPLPLRCVCKLWKSLILDPQFVKNHIYKSVTDDIVVLWAKAREHYKAFRSQLSKNPVVPQVEDDDAAVDDEDEDEEDDEEEEEGGGGDEEEGEASAEKHWLMQIIADLDDILVDIRELKKDLKTMKKELETIKADMQMQAQLNQEVAQMDNIFAFVRFVKRNFKTIRVNLQAVEDRVNCLKRFLKVYLKLAASSSSHF